MPGVFPEHAMCPKASQPTQQRLAIAHDRCEKRYIWVPWWTLGARAVQGGSAGTEGRAKHKMLVASRRNGGRGMGRAPRGRTW